MWIIDDVYKEIAQEVVDAANDNSYVSLTTEHEIGEALSVRFDVCGFIARDGRGLVPIWWDSCVLSYGVPTRAQTLDLKRLNKFILKLL